MKEEVIILYNSGVKVVHQVNTDINQMSTSTGVSKPVDFPVEDLDSFKSFVREYCKSMQCLPVEVKYTYATTKNCVPLQLFATKVDIMRTRVIVVYANNVIHDSVDNVRFSDFSKLRMLADEEVDKWYERNFN